MPTNENQWEQLLAQRRSESRSFLPRDVRVMRLLTNKAVLDSDAGLMLLEEYLDDRACRDVFMESGMAPWLAEPKIIQKLPGARMLHTLFSPYACSETGTGDLLRSSVFPLLLQYKILQHKEGTAFVAHLLDCDPRLRAIAIQYGLVKTMVEHCVEESHARNLFDVIFKIPEFHQDVEDAGLFSILLNEETIHNPEKLRLLASALQHMPACRAALRNSTLTPTKLMDGADTQEVLSALVKYGEEQDYEELRNADPAMFLTLKESRHSVTFFENIPGDFLAGETVLSLVCSDLFMGGELGPVSERAKFLNSSIIRQNVGTVLNAAERRLESLVSDPLRVNKSWVIYDLIQKISQHENFTVATIVDSGVEFGSLDASDHYTELTSVLLGNVIRDSQSLEQVLRLWPSMLQAISAVYRRKPTGTNYCLFYLSKITTNGKYVDMLLSEFRGKVDLHNLWNLGTTDAMCNSTHYEPYIWSIELASNILKHRYHSDALLALLHHPVWLTDPEFLWGVCYNMNVRNAMTRALAEATNTIQHAQLWEQVAAALFFASAAKNFFVGSFELVELAKLRYSQMGAASRAERLQRTEKITAHVFSVERIKMAIQGVDDAHF